MPVVYQIEYDKPKDEERNEKRLKFGREVILPYIEKVVEEKDIKLKYSEWSDNTALMLVWWEFESIEDFAKFWNDERWQQIISRWTYLADNVRTRLLRPSFTIPEDLK